MFQNMSCFVSLDRAGDPLDWDLYLCPAHPHCLVLKSLIIKKLVIIIEKV